MKIDSYKPRKFEDLIERIWILRNAGAETEIFSPPDQYINLIIPLNGSSWKHNNSQIRFPLLDGISLQSSVSKFPSGTKLVAIRFYSYALVSFFHVQAKNLVNTSIPIGNMEPLNSMFEGRLNDQEIIRTVEEYLDKQFIPEDYKKTILLRDFYQYFRWEHQAASIEEFCESFGTNYTSLNRQFSRVVGITAKRFERLIKFRKALCDLTDTNETFTNIGLDAGYFDQSHFIREFKLFMNYSPKTYNALIRNADKDTKIINYNFNLY